jgi:hypothetical protein
MEAEGPPAIELPEKAKQWRLDDGLNVIAAPSRHGKRWFIFCV